MSKQVKIWLVIAASFIVVGCIIFGSVMTVLKWDFKKLQMVKYETCDYDIDEKYNNISIVTKSADVLLLPSENLETSVVCYEQKNMSHSVTVKDGTLTIEVIDTRKWYEHIGINFASPKITVYIPQGEYGKLSVDVSTGDVEASSDFQFESVNISAITGDILIKNATVGALDLSVSTGDIIVESISCESDVKIKTSTGDAKLTDITCKNIISTGSTGDVFLKNVVAAEKITIDRSTGDANFEACDGAEIFVKTSTGDVKGRLLTNKVFMAKTDTGSVDVPKMTDGGKCEITTSTGDIKIDVSP